MATGIYLNDDEETYTVTFSGAATANWIATSRQLNQHCLDDLIVGLVPQTHRPWPPPQASRHSNSTLSRSDPPPLQPPTRSSSPSSKSHPSNSSSSDLLLHTLFPHTSTSAELAPHVSRPKWQPYARAAWRRSPPRSRLAPPGGDRRSLNYLSSPPICPSMAPPSSFSIPLPPLRSLSFPPDSHPLQPIPCRSRHCSEPIRSPRLSPSRTAPSSSPFSLSLMDQRHTKSTPSSPSDDRFHRFLKPGALSRIRDSKILTRPVCCFNTHS